MSDYIMSKKSGFTLLEVLLTIVLLVVGFGALMQALSIGLFGATQNENEVVGLHLAQAKMEELRNTPYANIINATRVNVTGFPAFTQDVVVATPQTGLKAVNVIVYWWAKSAEINVSLTTYISDI